MVIGNYVRGKGRLVFEDTVSVPLRGNGYRKSKQRTFHQLQVIMFPSPCGVMVIGNAPLLDAGRVAPTWFPSPCGVMVIGNLHNLYRLHLLQERVSVPLRGNGYRKSYSLETYISLGFQGSDFAIGLTLNHKTDSKYKLEKQKLIKSL